MTTPSFKMSKILPPLPRWELLVYFTVWLGHAVYAWYLVWVASTTLEHRLYSGFFEPGWRLLGDAKRDTSNFEWCSYFASLPVEVGTFVIHLVTMRLLDYSIDDQNSRDCILTLVWTGLLWIKLDWVGVVTTIVQGLLCLLVARLTRSKLAVWFIASCFLATLASDKYPLKDDVDFRYRFAVYVAYKLLHFISFANYHIDFKRGKVGDGEEQELMTQQNFLTAYWAMIRYTLYPPYSGTLIVTYQDYSSQWRRRRSSSFPVPTLMIVRVAVWTLFNDLLLHYIYNNAMMLDSYLLMEVDLFTLCAIGYTAGQYFYMKYVSIFGVNTIFALLDGMTPPKWPPICISRVALYSNMWRHFDRGLYSFLREHIFVPVALPSFSFWRRTLATLVCFGFIWLWHGLSWGFLYWVSLNFVEVTLENVTKQVYRIETVNRTVHSIFSPSVLRRFRAFLHVPCTALGIFSIFYFLGGVYVGDVFVNRIVLGEALYFNAPLGYLIILGYCFAQVCMEVESYVH